MKEHCRRNQQRYLLDQKPINGTNKDSKRTKWHRIVEINPCVSFVPKASFSTNITEKVIYLSEKAYVKLKSIATVIPNYELRFHVTLKDGDVVEMQEDPGATIEDWKARYPPTMFQTSNHRTAEDQSKNGPPRNGNCSLMEEEGKEGAMVVETECWEIVPSVSCCFPLL